MASFINRTISTMDWVSERWHGDDVQAHVSGAAMYHARVSDQLREKRESYSTLRRRCANVLEHDSFEWFMGLVILFNVVLLIMETDESGVCTHSEGNRCETTSWLPPVNNTLLILYTVELSLRTYTYRWDMFASKWNILDCFVVSTGHLDLLLSMLQSFGSMPSMVVLRMLRMARLLRAVRILIAFRELYLLIHGFTSAMMAIFWGLLLMIAMLVIWSVLSVELIGPVNARLDHEVEICDEAFSTVWLAALLYFQTMVAGDSWGTCALPIVKESPLTFVIFVGVLGTVVLGLSNLMLAVIVERASEAQQADVTQIMSQRLSQEVVAKKKLLDICESMDFDKNGKIRLEELLMAYEENEVLQTEMVVMGIEKDELHAMFQLMDRNELGDLPYDTFVDSLWRVKTKDVHVMLMLVKYHLLQVSTRVDQHHRALLQRLDAQDSLLRGLSPRPPCTADVPTDVPCSPRGGAVPCAGELAAELDRELNQCFERLGHLMANGASAVEWRRRQPASPLVTPSSEGRTHLELSDPPQFLQANPSAMSDSSQHLTCPPDPYQRPRSFNGHNALRQPQHLPPNLDAITPGLGIRPSLKGPLRGYVKQPLRGDDL